MAETVSHGYVALDQRYISEEELDLVNRQADVVWKKVNNFITYLNKSGKNKANKTKTNKMNYTNQTNRSNLTNETN